MDVTTSPPAAPAATTPPAGAWENRNKKVTFWLPIDLVQMLDNASRQSGVSKASMIDAALRAHLAPKAQ